jgi:hypothetical protein
MNHSQIADGNQKIAIFMGASLLRTEETEMPHGSHSSVTLEYWQRPAGLPGHDNFAHLGHFVYDRDWSWIMPVLAKIADTGYRYSLGRSNHGPYCLISLDGLTDVGGFASTEREAAWKAVIEFIDLYNLDELPTTSK